MGWNLRVQISTPTSLGGQSRLIKLCRHGLSRLCCGNKQHNEGWIKCGFSCGQREVSYQWFCLLHSTSWATCDLRFWNRRQCSWEGVTHSTWEIKDGSKQHLHCKIYWSKKPTREAQSSCSWVLELQKVSIACVCRWNDQNSRRGMWVLDDLQAHKGRQHA